MKKPVLIAITFLALSSAACNQEHRLRGEGDTITETRSISSFDKVDADGDVQVDVYPSTSNSIEVTGYANLVPVYETRVLGRTLRLKFEDRYWNIKHNNIRVKLYTSHVEQISMNGSGKITVHPGIPSDNLEMTINGSGNINIENNVFDVLRVRINGSGDVDAREGKADNVHAEISGSGKIEVTANERLDAKINGSGNIHYWGNPATVNTDINGSGKITRH